LPGSKEYVSDSLSSSSTSVALGGDEVLQGILDGRDLKREDAIRLMSYSGEVARALWSVAARLRTDGKGRIVGYSRKIFIPLTNLCRDACGYCTFKKDPWEEDAIMMTPEEVVSVAGEGREYRCTEALFTLGERPEQRYAEARDALRKLGFSTTLEYLRHASELVIKKTGLLPHANPGTMTKKEMASLRDVNASMGLMLENVAERLCKPGGPHAYAPSKHPKLRLATIKNAGELRIAFTTGLLIGIGETVDEIVDSLYAIKRLNDEYGHIQEIIVQNFRAKSDTPMVKQAEPPHEFMRNVVAVTRLLFGRETNVQVPPNLSPSSYSDFLSCGINDWGGISPVTKDYVNPEAPWPEVKMVKRACEQQGFLLKARLPIYPEFILRRNGFVPDPLSNLVHSIIDGQGYVSGSDMYN
jgi:7,8-didemethyl-8-hydroxy-5-deazariboflavin synthase CofG subunit